MSKIFCIVGKSGSGKDTLYHRILSCKKPDLVPVIPYTTRPRRAGERDGVNYFFVTDTQLEQYEADEEIIEIRRYHTVQGIWSYFTRKFPLEEGKNYVLITTLEGVQGILKYYPSDIVHIIYLILEEKERLLRCINREAEQETPDYLEVCRRYIADHEDFSEETLKSLQNLHTIDTMCNEKECMEQWWNLYQSLL